MRFWSQLYGSAAERSLHHVTFRLLLIPATFLLPLIASPAAISQDEIETIEELDTKQTEADATDIDTAGDNKAANNDGATSAARRAVVLVLDCSNSMNAKAVGSADKEIPLTSGDEKSEAKKPSTSSRLSLAKSTLKALVEQIQREGDSRVALSAFGHRAKFGSEVDEDGKAKVVSGADGVHPFTDYEVLVDLADDEAPTSKTDFDRMRSALDKIESGKGFTPLYYSLIQAATGIKESAADQAGEIVVFTDGVNYQGAGKFRPEGGDEISAKDLQTEWNKYFSDIRVQIVLVYPSGNSYRDYIDGKKSQLESEIASADEAGKVKRQQTLQYIAKIIEPRYENLKALVELSDGTMTLLESNEGSFAAIPDSVLATFETPVTTDNADKADDKDAKMVDVKTGDDEKDEKADPDAEIKHSLAVKILFDSKLLESHQEPSVTIKPDDGTMKRVSNDSVVFTGLLPGVRYEVTATDKITITDVEGKATHRFPQKLKKASKKELKLNMAVKDEDE